MPRPLTLLDFPERGLGTRLHFIMTIWARIEDITDAFHSPPFHDRSFLAPHCPHRPTFLFNTHRHVPACARAPDAQRLKWAWLNEQRTTTSVLQMVRKSRRSSPCSVSSGGRSWVSRSPRQGDARDRKRRSVSRC